MSVLSYVQYEKPNCSDCEFKFTCKFQKKIARLYKTDREIGELYYGYNVDITTSVLNKSQIQRLHLICDKDNDGLSKQKLEFKPTSVMNNNAYLCDKCKYKNTCNDYYMNHCNISSFITKPKSLLRDLLNTSNGKFYLQVICKDYKEIDQNGKE